MQTETAIHSGRDSLNRPLTDGRYVLIHGANRELVTVQVDPELDCPIILIRGRPHRMEDMDPGAIFSRLVRSGESPAPSKLRLVEDFLTSARSYREGLGRIESGLAEQLGCQAGDGSEIWDAISAAVRDGLGTAVDLLDLTGALRR